MIGRCKYASLCVGFSLIFTFWCWSSSLVIAQTLVNPDFEDTIRAGNHTSWVLGSDEQPISLGQGAGGAGNALVLHSDTPQGQHFSQRASLSVSSLSQYTLSFDVKAQTKGKTRGFAWVNLLDADSALLLEQGYGNFQGTQEWDTFSQTFFVPKGTETIRVGGSITGEGTLWFDNFILEEVTYQPDSIHLSAEADDYIKAVVDTMQTHALYKDRLNFEDIYQVIRFHAQGANVPEDTYSAIRASIPYLVDHHSAFFTPAELKKYFGDIDIKATINNNKYLERNNVDIDSLKATINFSHGRLIEDEVGYLAIAEFTHLYQVAVAMYSDSLQQLVKQFDQRPLKGWVIDLRNNSGGATDPMVAGIGPLLPEDNIGYYVNAQHQPMSIFYYRNGAQYQHEVGEEQATPILESKVAYQVKDSTLPIAVLIGPGAASAAEGVATILAGTPNVKMFGKRTAGLTTGNEFIVLADDAVLNLTTSFLANRDQEVYERGITPNIVVDSESDQDGNQDAVLQAALQWISKQ